MLDLPGARQSHNAPSTLQGKCAQAAIAAELSAQFVIECQRYCRVKEARARSRKDSSNLWRPDARGCMIISTVLCKGPLLAPRLCNSHRPCCARAANRYAMSSCPTPASMLAVCASAVPPCTGPVASPAPSARRCCRERKSACLMGSGMRYLQHASTTETAVSSETLCPAAHDGVSPLTLTEHA